MSDFISSLRLFLLSLIACSVVYPAAILGFAIVVASEARQGSLIRDGRGTIIGSRLLAQDFTCPEYFWPRPSAVDYDASAAGGSNLSPTNPAIAERAREIIERLDTPDETRIPTDLLTASGSGLDPHITLSAARIQIPRVAAARGLSEEEVRSLVERHTDSPTLTRLGAEPLVHVLELNLALDYRRAIE